MTNLPTPIEEIKHPILDEKKIQLFVKRDDLIHPEIMGNKWRKLKYNLQEMKTLGVNALVTMGGAYSNHIAATAAAANEHNLSAVGIIRGDELNENSNITLQKAKDYGMQLVFTDRATFKRWRDNPEEVKETYPNHYFLHEGGTNQLAIKGCTEITEEIKIPYDMLVTPIGTGGTMAGLIQSSTSAQVLGVSCLKGVFIFEEIRKLLQIHQIDGQNYQITDRYHFGGYARTTSELIDFINWFKEKFNIKLDPIYTGKSFFAVWDMINKDKFEKNLRIVLLHTGGLQGISGFNRKNENIIQ